MKHGYDYWPASTDTQTEDSEALLTSPGAVRSAVAAGLGSLLSTEELALLNPPEAFTQENK